MALAQDPISDANIIAAVNSATPSQWSATWGIPAHLLNGSFPSGASEASSIEFDDPQGVNKATVLILKLFAPLKTQVVFMRMTTEDVAAFTDVSLKTLAPHKLDLAIFIVYVC